MECPPARVAVAFGLVVALMGVRATSVHADDTGANFALNPGATCLTEPRLLERLATWLAQPLPAQGAAGSLRIEGSPHDPRSVRVTVLLDGEVWATRAFEPGPPRCEDLVDAVAIAAAMMLQALPAEAWATRGATDAPPEPESEPKALPPPPAPPPQPAPKPTAAHAPAEDTTRSPLPLRLGMAAAAVAKPARGGSGAGARAGLVLDLGTHLDLRASALVVASPARPLAEGQGHYQSLSYAGSLGVCAGQHGAARLGVRACTELLGGELRVHAADTSRTPTVAVAFGLRAQLRLSDRWLASVGISLLHRPRSIQVQGRDAGSLPLGTTAVPRTAALLELGLRRTVFTKAEASWDMKKQ